MLNHRYLEALALLLVIMIKLRVVNAEGSVFVPSFSTLLLDDTIIKGDESFKISFEARVQFETRQFAARRKRSIELSPKKVEAFFSEVDVGITGELDEAYYKSSDFDVDTVETINELPEEGNFGLSGKLISTLPIGDCHKANFLCISISQPIPIGEFRRRKREARWSSQYAYVCRNVQQQRTCGYNCPPGSNGNYYDDNFNCFEYGTQGGVSMMSAQADCVTLGTSIAEITDQSISNFLAQIVFPKAGADSVWIGLKSNAWESTTPVTWTNWIPGEAGVDICTTVDLTTDPNYYWKHTDCASTASVALCQFVHSCVKNPCNNRGQCVPTGLTTFFCDCHDGFDGEYCTFSSDHCINNTCSQNSTCVNSGETYECICQAGYDGNTCSNDINECASDPCVNGGICADNVNGYSCTCPKGYNGINCEIEINDCLNVTCSYHGACVDEGSSWRCNCFDGWAGDDCEQETIVTEAPEIESPECSCNQSSACKDDTCQNNGTCLLTGDSYYCLCLPNYTGDNCENKTFEAVTELDTVVSLDMPFDDEYKDKKSQKYKDLVKSLKGSLYDEQVIRGYIGEYREEIDFNPGSVIVTVRFLPEVTTSQNTANEALSTLSSGLQSGSLNINGVEVPVKDVEFTLKDDEVIAANYGKDFICELYQQINYCKQGSNCEYVDGAATCVCLTGWTGGQCDVKDTNNNNDFERKAIYALFALFSLLLALVIVLIIAFPHRNYIRANNHPPLYYHRGRYNYPKKAVYGLHGNSSQLTLNKRAGMFNYGNYH